MRSCSATARCSPSATTSACLSRSGRAGQRDGRALRPGARHLGRGPEPEQAAQGAGHGRHVGWLRDGPRRPQRRRPAVLEHEAVRARDRDLDGRSADGARAGPAARGDPARRQGARRQPHRSGERGPVHERAPGSGRRLAGSRRPRCHGRPGSTQMVGLADGTVLAVGTFEGDTESSPVAYRLRSRRGHLERRPGTGAVRLRARRPARWARARDRRQSTAGSWRRHRRPDDGVQRFDTRSGAWAPVASMSTRDREPQVAVLADGRVLVAGGSTGERAPTEPRPYAPPSSTTRPRTAGSPGSDLREPRYGGHALALPDGSVLILGGARTTSTPKATRPGARRRSSRRSGSRRASAP